MSKHVDITIDYGRGVSKSGKPYKEVTANTVEIGADVVVRIARPDLIDTTGMSQREARRATGNAINTHFDLKVVGRVTGLGEAYYTDGSCDATLVQRAYYEVIEG